MSLAIPQSTTHLVVFKAYLASDHVTEATGKTIAITISKNGGAFGNPNAGATNATEISFGWYKVSLDTTDTGTLGPIAIRGAVATIDDVGIDRFVVKATNGGFTALPDAAAEAAGGLYTRGSGAGQIAQQANGQVDTNLSTIKTQAVTCAGGVTVPAATLASTANIITAALGATERTAIADAMLDETNGVETSWTVRMVLRIVFAVLGGKASGMGTATGVFRSGTDSKDRVTATQDASGNRTAVTLDGT